MCVLVSIGMLISTLEWLFNWQALRDDGALSWTLFQTRRQLWNRPLLVWMATPFFGFPNFLILLAARAAGAIALMLFAADAFIRPIALTAIVVSTLLIHARSWPYGFSGADRMSLVVAGALWLRECAPADKLAADASLWFIAVQSCLSYVTAGLPKLFSPTWRNGAAVRATFSHSLTGNAFLSSKPGWNTLSGLLAWSVILGQCLFPLAVLTPWPFGLVFIAWALLFHLSAAAFMGFNTFIWAWAATYPAVIHVALVIHGVRSS